MLSGCNNGFIVKKLAGKVNERNIRWSKKENLLHNR